MNHPEILHAGKLSMLYEKGNLRYISSGRNEIIRMIYSAVRDKEWNTLQPEIFDEKLDIGNTSFRISYKCRYSSPEIDFEAFFEISGNDDNSIILRFEGKALKSFKKNRIGFCVLHPVEFTAGTKCRITHTDNSTENSEFPFFISPDQPFTDIKAMNWDTGGLNCSLTFHGDIFETEDQRNWTDASYKTYCTPLERPFPVTLQEGEIISQHIEFQATGSFADAYRKEKRIKLTFCPDNVLEMPLIGIGRSTRPKPLTDNEILILKKLEFDHYRIDIYLFEDDWRSKATEAITESVSLGYAVELALFFDNDPIKQCNELIELLLLRPVKISCILLFDKKVQVTPDHITKTLSPSLRKAFPDIKIAIGTNANFTQLNRNRPESNESDYLCYSIHPQEHATDNTTLTENLKGQEYTVASALNFCRHTGIWISPVTLRRRFNANISNYEVPSEEKGIPAQADPRQMSLFGAAWCAGSLKYLCESGVKGITFFETGGERGIIQGDYSSRWPETFPSAAGMLFPVYYVFEFVFRHKHFKIIKGLSSDPLKADALTLTNGKQNSMIIFNYTDDIQEVEPDIDPDHKRTLMSQIYYEPGSKVDGIITLTTESHHINTDKILLLPPFSITFIDTIC